MKHTLTISIECGENTCASEPGIFCEHFGATNFGTRSVCLLFSGDDKSGATSYTPLIANDGWIQRCDACKEATK